MNQTIKKIETILTSKFNATSYVDLVREIFPDVSLFETNNFRKEYSNFSSHIEGSTHVGNYTDPDGKEIIIFSVQLKKKSYVENSRSTQRNFAKKLLENGNADAAFIAFYTEDDPKWRLSLVRLDYSIKVENGKLKAAEDLTPAKRYSYLVGEDEPCHTAISRFHDFIVDSTNTVMPTLDSLEEAFSVEKVTDEFFDLYCEKFHQLREALENNEDFVIEAEHHNFTSAQFAKKLMGQIVFLYFLQKKGWLGVKAWPDKLNTREYKNAFYAQGAKSRELIPLVYHQTGEDEYSVSGKAINALSDEDEKVLASCVTGNPWGTGPKRFMRTLFEFSQKKNANFFDDYLEPLFYNALNVNRGDRGYDPALHCRIPFLSGGLFEPIDGYDWEHNNFSIPNEIFSNKKNENDRDADGILDIFDRYNFTMSEDEPMEREVAIDPEMLGKVFENLLEVNDRRSKGAFYTPREIVHYMCQETLISYLVNETGLKERDIRDFILLGDFMRDEDTAKDKREGQTDMFISEDIYKIDAQGNVVVNRLNDIDTALANIRICDPAVGSGAFPLGMLNEIVRARQNITAYLAINMKPRDKQYLYSNERSPYSLKRETIKNCIFGADIEPSAVDIAQLRLWLSLVIDDDINPNAQTLLEGHKNPIPLPNLENNILCGNSLVDKFEGIKLINLSSIIGTNKSEQGNLYQSSFNALLLKLIEKQDKLFNCENTNTKKQLIKDIADIKDEIIRSQLPGITKETWNKYLKAKEQSSKPFVLWQIDFAKVFSEKGGFDVVIGNPPYIQLQKAIDDEGTKLGDLYKDLDFDTFTRTGDIYCLFYEKGYSLLHDHGILSFITSNKWMRTGYGEKLRKFLAEKTNPKRLVDFAGQKVFESATVDVSILNFCKEENTESTGSCTIKEKYKDNLSTYVENNSTPISYNTSNSWVILSSMEQNIKRKIEAVGTPLKDWDIEINYGIKTGCNEAFIISSEKKDELIAKDPKSEEIIKPILRGRDIKRYGYNFADLWLINSHNGVREKNIPPVNINSYPAVKEHLDAFYEKLSKRSDKGDTPYNLRNCVYLDDFSKQKIIYPNMTKFLPFMYDEDAFMTNQKCFIITGENIGFLTAFLNSSLFKFCFSDNFPRLGDTGRELSKIFFIEIPVIRISNEQNKEFENLVKIVQKNKHTGQDTLALEKQIDEMIFDLYNLSKDERSSIGFIEIK